MRGRSWVLPFALLSIIQLPGGELGAHQGSPAEVYHEYCSVCHGDRGDGQSRARGGLQPPPRDFTTTQAAAELSRERIVTAIRHGRPDTAMVGWAERLDDEQILALADYLRSEFMGLDGDAAAATGDDHGHAGDAHHDHPEHQHGTVPDLVGDATRGRRLYRDNCVACHGSDGDGEGPRAYFIYPRPRNLAHPASRGDFNREVLFRAIKYGVRGREMPAWGKVLDDRQILDITAYLLDSLMASAAGAVEQTHEARDGHAH